VRERLKEISSGYMHIHEHVQDTIDMDLGEESCRRLFFLEANLVHMSTGALDFQNI
jgi:hypothetical protein